MEKKQGPKKVEHGGRLQERLEGSPKKKASIEKGVRASRGLSKKKKTQRYQGSGGLFVSRKTEGEREGDAGKNGGSSNTW